VTDVSPQPKCSQCGRPLDAVAPGGLCLRCLLELGLKSSGADESSTADPPPTADLQDDTFEQYRVIEKIGEGGCGIVYRAEQLAPVRREVALKVIKLGLDTRAVLTRFEAERQALALMDHPHIARVFDAGVSQRGRPFFAMELVPGEPITDYCDRRGLSVRQRLHLFILVCQALEHAHQKGVIHRDIKPSNILVAEQDGRPVPKVIDFGVAKATAAQRLADQTLYTAFDQFVGTPAYMSPEQAALAGEDIDTRSDLYSLGVLLYELLTGRTPFEPERLRQAALDELCRIIRQEDPDKPSTRVATLPPKDLSFAADRRGLPPSRFAAQLRGDLDWVVMKALEKDRARRYPSAGSLAADVQRHLAHEPVVAGPPTVLYRFKKYVRRNRLLAASIAAVALALTVGLGLSTWLYFREQEARRWAESRAYASDMGLASRMCTQSSGLAGVERLLAAWRDRQPDRRGWEWYYLNGLCHPEELCLAANADRMSAVAWNPEGTRLAAGSMSGRIQQFDARTGASLLSYLGHTGAVNSLAWSSDGAGLASGGADGVVRLWSATATTNLAQWTGSGRPVLSVAWDPDGTTLAASDGQGRVFRWTVATGAPLPTLRGPSIAYALTWSPDGNRLAAVGSSSSLTVWDTASDTVLLARSPQPGTPIFRSAAWSPDGRSLAVGCEDYTVKLLDPATGTNFATLWDHRHPIVAVVWSSDGTRLASTDEGDGTVRVWDVKAARVVRSFRGHQGPAKSVAWQPGSHRLASAGSDGTVRVWDADRPGQSLRPLRHPNQVLSLSWHPDGKRLAAGGRHDSAVIWDTTQRGKPIDLSAPVQWVWAVAWSPDGSRLATVGNDNVVRLWHPDGRPGEQLSSPGPGARTLAWSPDGRCLAFAGRSSGLCLWATNTTHLTRIPLPPDQHSYALAWRPDGRELAVSAGLRILLFHPTNTNPHRVLSGHSEVVRSLAWAPDGSRLASAGDDSLARIWHLDRDEPETVLTGHTAPVYAVAWNPDGSRLITASWDSFIKLWDPVAGVELCSFAEHASQVAAAVFSPDGFSFASSDLDGMIYLRDATPGYRYETRREGAAAPTPALAPRHSSADNRDALVWYRDTAERFRHLEQDLHSHRLLVRFLADCPYPELRDGRKAVELGEQAAALSHRNNAAILDDLAAAYAEAGDFPKAVAVQTEAIALLNNPKTRAEYTIRLRDYESERPSRDSDW
jgi:WD40 repeat protein/serine/threonine protein kinase